MSDLLLSIIPPPGSKAPVFSFKASSIAYKTLERVMTYSWKAQGTVALVQKPNKDGSLPPPCYAKQFGGQADDLITLTGLLYPLHVKDGLTRIDHLRKLAAEGKPMSLIVSDDTTAKKLNRYGYVIKQIKETQSKFTRTGDSLIPNSLAETHTAPQKIDFTVTLSSFHTCAVVPGSQQGGNKLPAEPKQ